MARSIQEETNKAFVPDLSIEGPPNMSLQEGIDIDAKQCEELWPDPKEDDKIIRWDPTVEQQLQEATKIIRFCRKISSCPEGESLKKHLKKCFANMEPCFDMRCANDPIKPFGFWTVCPKCLGTEIENIISHREFLDGFKFEVPNDLG
jgi:hypothetical protein